MASLALSSCAVCHPSATWCSPRTETFAGQFILSANRNSLVPRGSLPVFCFRKSRRGYVVSVISVEGEKGEMGEPLPPFLEGPLERPTWTGKDPLSKILNFIIGVKPLFGLMQIGAREVFISTAEKAGVPWRERVSQLRNSPEVFEEKERLENKNIAYPSYYLQEFHAYEKGNLCWDAAFEVESATASMCLRTFPTVQSVSRAAQLLRGGWLSAIERHRTDEGREETVFRDILDVGCGAGLSTRCLQEAYPEANVVGLDLSPYFLAVASYQQKQRDRAREGENTQNGVGAGRIQWMHAMGEDTRLPEASFDLVSLAYVMHECPEEVTRAMIREALRLLRPGGVVAITDNAPTSKVIQSLPPFVFTLMKATEPFSDDYFLLDMERAVRDAGFCSVVSVLSDPRHRTLTATK